MKMYCFFQHSVEVGKTFSITGTKISDDPLLEHVFVNTLSFKTNGKEMVQLTSCVATELPDDSTNSVIVTRQAEILQHLEKCGPIGITTACFFSFEENGHKEDCGFFWAQAEKNNFQIFDMRPNSMVANRFGTQS